MLEVDVDVVVVDVDPHTHWMHSQPGFGGFTHSRTGSTANVVDVVVLVVEVLDVVVTVEVVVAREVVVGSTTSCVPEVMHPETRRTSAMNPPVRRLRPIIIH